MLLLSLNRGLPLTLNQQLPVRGDQRHRLRLRRRPCPYYILCVNRGVKTARRVFLRAELIINQYQNQTCIIRSASSSLNTLCTLVVYTRRERGSEQTSIHTSYSQESVWYTESASEHTEKMYMFQLIRTYLCVYTSLCPAHFIQTERRSRAGRHVEEHVVLALMPRRQEHRGVNNRKSVASTTRNIFISVLNQTLPTRQPSCRTEEAAGIIVRQRPVRPCISTIYTPRSSTG